MVKILCLRIVVQFVVKTHHIRPAQDRFNFIRHCVMVGFRKAVDVHRPDCILILIVRQPANRGTRWRQAVQGAAGIPRL